MGTLPSGTVTFLFTDIEGSTKLAQGHPDKWESLRERHHNILQSAMDAHNGYVFQIIGDALCVAFHTAGDALRAAIKSQTDLHNEDWDDMPIKVRIGINTGVAHVENKDDDSSDYKGYATLARVQRVMSIGHGGQILLSNTGAELVRGELPEHVSLRDMGEHRLKGLLNPEHLWQINAPGLPQEFPPLQSLNVIPTNLPVQLTNFVGREKEILEVKDELAKHRLVTLTGSGGTGKTRLSLQVAAELLDSFHEGVWFIELASLSNPDLIPSTILSTLDISEQQGRPALKVLEEYLAPKKLLIVLDNCEHLIADAAKVANAILNAAPNLKILASSREALGVKGELSWHVPSLSLPDPKNIPDLNGLTQYEAVRLFIDRAALVDSHFTVTKDNAPAIAQICCRLDGIPLALELAAARVKMLSVDQISARLDDRFRLLTGGARTALPRQQTLRSLIDWSYDLLSDSEKLLLRRLAVFVGGWTLEIAEQVCSDEKIDQYEILDMLGKLVDKSLVAVTQNQLGARYRILETIRQYAREKLFDSGEGESLRQKHSEWFLSAAKHAEQESLSGQNEIDLHNRFENDIENYRSALDWLLATEQFENYARLASALGVFWFELSYYKEGLDWLETGLIHRARLSKMEIVRILRISCRILARMGNYELAISYGEEGVTLMRELNDKAELPLTIEYLATVLSENGDEKGSDIYYDEALTLYRELGNQSGISNMMIEIGWGNITARKYTEGFTILEESLKLKRELGEVYGIAYCLFVLGTCRWHSYEYDKSEIALKEGIKLLYKLGNKWFAASCLSVLAGISSKRHRPQQAAKYMGVIDKVHEAIRGSTPPFWERDVSGPILASIHEQLNDVDYDKAYYEGYSMTLEQALTFILDAANE